MEKNEVKIGPNVASSRLGTQNYENADSAEVDDTSAPPLWFSKRLLVSLLMFLNFMNYQIIRCNINIAIVEMTSKKSYVEGNKTVQKADFNWDSATVGVVLSLSAYGGIFSFFGGFLADYFGGAVACAVSTLISGIITMAQPVTLCFDFLSFVVLRLLTGLCGELFYVSAVEVHSLWFPKKEKSLLLAISFNGYNAGSTIVFPFCGYLAHAYGWEMVFYVTGAITVLFAIVFWIFVKNAPSQDKWISKKELEYILADTDHDASQKVSYPFRTILRSGPVWSLFGLLFVITWIDTIIVACLPLYVKDLTHRGTDQVGLMSSIPNVVFFFVFPLCGMFLDYWKNHSGMTLTRMHKIILGSVFSCCAISLIVIAFVSDITLALMIFLLMEILMSPVMIILQFITINLAPEHCNAISALGSVFLSLGAVLSQTSTGFLLSRNSMQGWNICFFSAAVVSAVGAAWFLVFGSSETQPWSVIAFKT